MNVSLYQAASALGASERWQEMIAQNMAASGIAGYKRQQVSFAAVQAGLLPAAAAPYASGVNSYSLPKAQTTTSFLPGEMKYTGVNTDVAIDGNAFFEVQLPNGSLAYTRNGEFKLDAQGQLVTKEGYFVLSDGGPIQLDLNNRAELSISASGEVSQGNEQKGKLRLAEFDNPALLTQVNGGYFLANHPSLQRIDSTTSTVRQGFVEGPNTSAVAEMASLLAALRNFEASHRVIQIQNERMGRTISELGNPG